MGEIGCVEDDLCRVTMLLIVGRMRAFAQADKILYGLVDVPRVYCCSRLLWGVGVHHVRTPNDVRCSIEYGQASRVHALQVVQCII